jgi:hypothetical protein
VNTAGPYANNVFLPIDFRTADEAMLSVGSSSVSFLTMPSSNVSEAPAEPEMAEADAPAEAPAVVPVQLIMLESAEDAALCGPDGVCL